MRTVSGVDLNAVTGAGDALRAVGAEGTILQWNGAIWARVGSPTRSALDGVHKVAADVWASGLDGHDAFRRWHAGGWTVFESETTADLRTIWARNDRDVWVAGDNFTLRHWDGATWTALHDDTADADTTLFRIWRADRRGVWVVGTRTTIVLAIPGER